jgi:hypothetical protein
MTAGGLRGQQAPRVYTQGVFPFLQTLTEEGHTHIRGWWQVQNSSYVSPQCHPYVILAPLEQPSPATPRQRSDTYSFQGAPWPGLDPVL